jgi:hypothetical protein
MGLLHLLLYCVSTHKQGNLGLGLDAQRVAVKSFLQGAAPVGEYVEVESGKKNQRSPRG